VPRFSYGRALLRDDGAPNRLFITYLFSDQAMAIRFLQDVGLLRSQVQCNICGRDIFVFFFNNHVTMITAVA
jgi:hypothetical protein